MESTAANVSENSASRLTARQEKRSGIVAHAVEIAPLPRWVTTGKAGASIPEIALIAGAATLALDQIMRAEPAWLGALRMRQALNGAIVTARLLRLDADEASLRDAEHLTRSGDDPGPAGRLHRLFRQFASQPLRQSQATLLNISGEVGTASSGAEIIALLQADLALARRLGWSTPLPLHISAILDPALKLGETGKRPMAGSAAWAELQYTVLAHAAIAVHIKAMTLQRKASLLMAAAAGLRTKGGSQGVRLVLSDDSVAPWKMIGRKGLGSDRAARRFCETLAAQGKLHLLTERPTFRLYGL